MMERPLNFPLSWQTFLVGISHSTHQPSCFGSALHFWITQLAMELRGKKGSETQDHYINHLHLFSAAEFLNESDKRRLMREEDTSLQTQTARQSILYSLQKQAPAFSLSEAPALLSLLLQPGLPSNFRLSHFWSHLPEQGVSGQSSHLEPQKTRNSTRVAAGNPAVELSHHQHRVTCVCPPCQPRSMGEQTVPAALLGEAPACLEQPQPSARGSLTALKTPCAASKLGAARVLFTGMSPFRDSKLEYTVHRKIQIHPMYL